LILGMQSGSGNDRGRVVGYRSTPNFPAQTGVLLSLNPCCPGIAWIA